MKLGFRYPRMDLCCLAERVDGLNGNNEMLSKLPHHDIIILFQNDSYLPYYRNYTREEIYMGWHDAAFQSKNYDTETYKYRIIVIRLQEDQLYCCRLALGF